LGLAAALGACASLGSAGLPFARSGSLGRSAAGNYLAAEHAGFERDGRTAGAYFARALDADPNNPAILERAFLFAVADGEIARAADFARRIVALDPKSRMARLILSIEALKAGRYEAASAQIDAPSGEDAADVVWIMIQAWASAGAGQSDKAAAILSSEGARTSLGAFALYHEALLLEFSGRTAEADRAYGTAILAASGRSVRLLEAYGRFLSTHDRSADAVKLYETYLRTLPGNPVVESLLAAARTERADKIALVSSPAEGAAEALYGIAVVLSADRSAVLPLVYLQLALYLRPDLDIALALRGELYEAEEEWEKAARSFAAIPKTSPLEPYAAVSVAHDLARLGRFDEAARLMRNRVSEDPSDAQALVALGDLNRAQEKWTDAASSYARALEAAGSAGEDRWQILYARGVALERAGDWPQAETLLQEALALQPGQPQVLNYLGYSWIDRGERLTEALALIGRAVAARPDDGYIVDSLGWAHYRLGDYHSATKYLEHAVELKPDDPTINDHLGDAYWRVGRRLEARFQWNHALQFKPEAEDAKRIAKKLEGGLEDGAPAATGSRS
jgi:tetratricopeptide (TPR) repeat protein